ncbi:MAG: M67 family metallopeptidase [Pyrinomonadaceae bacterium MAG19_C2-C3]|nr:M67 family metallopeptidase [Pyrinomonadaceae bacterium MAG19_C2-C3]
MINLKREHLATIGAHGERDYPYECCGLLIGTFADDGTKTVEEIYSISNARAEADKRHRFLITPQEFMRGERHARSRQLDVIGIYHSHPDDKAEPSQFDLDHALPVYSYIIISVREGRATDVFSWLMEDDRSRFNAEEIMTTEN